MTLYSSNNASTIVEFALLLPILLLMSLASIDVGLYLYDRQTAKTVMASQISGLLSESSHEKIGNDLASVLGSVKFYRVSPELSANVILVCLCADESLRDFSGQSDYLCTTPVRCEPASEVYRLVSLDFAIKEDSFFLSNSLFVAPFKESIAVRVD